ncbi:probable serine/threonine-protein kinase DDB_G0282963 isoform X1 [Episyrphus balteatus]|uniref:probable serine/threonine-protein kinase DDB_G0282963 isoform X1 n=1 Tax=Episyrphus balteatus TaxID=286459 RepID=UPI0024867BA0|nr:probable serine/threonine-protein kinase DDB_G0282963 isoform X1 [Episyrphus balteatus]XP_055839168.1 probable serine/threonine-protein kinase DDB_G0282963 isoform X1 [Episyrphus balteatus]XP_055839169.1 probable serine/threonine-protein kinase DDB_G0282963 isoform X1 [Episyrphus balteatus]
MRPPLIATSAKNEVVQPLALPSQNNHKSLLENQQLLTTSNNNNIHIGDFDPSEFRIVDLSTSPPVTPETAFDRSPNHQQQQLFHHHQTALRSNSNSNFFVNNLDEKYVLFESFASSDDTSLNIESAANHHHHHLPLSETEPLLTNIEATVSDPDRSICLHKNSASLIFTKKEVSSNNSRRHHHHHHHRVNSYTDDQSIESQPFLSYQRQSIGATASEYSANQTKHLHSHHRNSSNHHNHHNYLEKSSGGRVQHHRRSLPLNYSGGTNNSNNASQRSGNYSANKQTTNTTAANTRKQHAYSWYAPVYSALEEELEQESRDSSPIHNLANAKKTPSHQVPCSENETVSLLDSKNQLNIQPQLHLTNLRARRAISSPQPPTNLTLPLTSTTTTTNNATYPPPYNNNNLVNGIHNQTNHHQQNENEGPHAGSLLAGGPIPRRRRFENFLKSLVGRKPSKDTSFSPPLLPSPEITITRTPSDQNVILRDPSGMRQPLHPESVSYLPDKVPTTSSTTSLNTAVQQKLWNVVPLLRREGSAASLHHEKSQSIVQYTGMRKCETVLALTRQSSSVCSPVSDTSGTPLGGSRTGGIRDSGGGCSINGIEQIRPLNRLRNSMSTSNATCSRCSSLLSLAVSGSRYSLNTANSGFVNVNNNSNNLNNNFSNLSSSSIISKTNDCVDGGSSSNGSSRKSSANDSSNIPPSNVTTATLNSTSSPSSGSSPLSPIIVSSISGTAVATLPVELEEFTCKLCLVDVAPKEATTLAQCGCRFCTECMRAYVEFEISEGAYDISCPDAQCPSQGVVALNEIDKLTSQNLMKKHHRYRLNREIELDKFRTWCPRAGCETVCLVGCTSDSALAPSSSSNEDKDNAILQAALCPVQCPSCKDEFCSGCKKPWHPNMSCDENNRRLAADGQDDIGIPFDNDLIKCCPMCAVPIEKDEGCAQMMCKRCKHVFCWYCLASLDDDFLLRHYDKGPCKNKLGHSRASVVWHRAQVIGIFAGFGILLLVASPLLLLAAPCIICCKCRICSGGNKMEEGEGDMEEATALQR